MTNFAKDEHSNIPSLASEREAALVDSIERGETERALECWKEMSSSGVEWVRGFVSRHLEAAYQLAFAGELEELAREFFSIHNSRPDGRVRDLCESLAAKFAFSSEFSSDGVHGDQQLWDASFWNGDEGRENNPNAGLNNLEPGQRSGRMHTDS